MSPTGASAPSCRTARAWTRSSGRDPPQDIERRGPRPRDGSSQVHLRLRIVSVGTVTLQRVASRESRRVGPDGGAFPPMALYRETGRWAANVIACRVPDGAEERVPVSAERNTL